MVTARRRQRKKRTKDRDDNSVSSRITLGDGMTSRADGLKGKEK